MRMTWLAAISAAALIGGPATVTAQQPKDKPATENKTGDASKDAPKAEGKKAGQEGQAAAPSGSDTAAGSSDNSGSGTTGSSTGGFSSSNRLNDPSPSRTMQPGGQY